MKIKIVCYNVITFLISTSSNLKHVIYFYFQKNSTKFLALTFIVYAKYVLMKDRTPYYYHVTIRGGVNEEFWRGKPLDFVAIGGQPPPPSQKKIEGPKSPEKMLKYLVLKGVQNCFWLLLSNKTLYTPIFLLLFHFYAKIELKVQLLRKTRDRLVARVWSGGSELVDHSGIKLEKNIFDIF